MKYRHLNIIIKCSNYSTVKLCLCSVLQPMWVALLRTLSRSCWCAGTRQPLCSLFSEVTLQIGQSVGSRGCLERKPPLRSALQSSWGTSINVRCHAGLWRKEACMVCLTKIDQFWMKCLSFCYIQSNNILMIPEWITGLFQSCLSCDQVLFAAILVHSFPQGSHFWSASTQVSAAPICCSRQVLQAKTFASSPFCQSSVSLIF